MNDSLTGLVVGAELLRQLTQDKETRKYGIRLLVVPETIGTIAWFDRFKEERERIEFAWFAKWSGMTIRLFYNCPVKRPLSSTKLFGRF